MTYCPTHPPHFSFYVKLLLFVVPVCFAHAPLVRGDITADIPAQQRVGAHDVMWTRCGGAQAGDPVERRLKTISEDLFQVVRIQISFLAFKTSAVVRVASLVTNHPSCLDMFMFLGDIRSFDSFVLKGWALSRVRR